MSQNSLEHLEILLNDYYNSEKNLYWDLKNKLLNGIEMVYAGPKISSIKNENEIFDFIQIISDGEISFSYQKSIMEHNYRLSFFSDDIIQLKLYGNDILIFNKKFSLSSFSSYTITRQFPNLIGEKMNYKVHLKLFKNGEERKNFEKTCIDECDGIARGFIKELYELIHGWRTAGSMETDHLMIFNLLKERMKLFHFTVKTEHDLITALNSFQMSDLGIKDIVKMSYLIDIFFTHSLSNKDMFKQLEEIILIRKKSYEGLCQKIQNLK